MAIRRAEGYAHFTTGADWQAKGHDYVGTAPTFHPTNGRGGRGCAIMGQQSPAQGLTTIMPVVMSPLYDHFAFYSPALSTIYWAYYNTAGYDHVKVVLSSDGSFSLYRGSAAGTNHNNLVFSTLIASSNPNWWRANTFHHIQIEIKPTSTGGIFILKVDGIEVTELSQSGISMYAGGAQNITKVIRSGVSGDTVLYSDSVQIDDAIDDAALQQYTGFQGDLAVYESVDPTDGDELEWSRATAPVDSGTWSSRVNQNPQDGDTTYDRSATAQQKLCFSFPVITSAVGTILAIKETACIRKEDATFGAFRLYSRSDDNVDHNFDLLATAQTYGFDEQIIEKDQKDGSDWTPTKVNNTQLGIYDASDEG